MNIRKLTDAVKRVLFPRRASCIACGSLYGQKEDWLCGDCAKKLEACRVGMFDGGGRIALALAVYSYVSPASDQVRLLKYSAVKGLAEAMGGAMADAFLSSPMPAPDCVTNVPMPKKRRRRRGIDHTRELTNVFIGRTGLAYEELLVRTGRAKQQARLDRAGRRRNAGKSFAGLNGAKGRTILVLDDVYTTGSTARACADALMKAGARGVYFICYAKTPGK